MINVPYHILHVENDLFLITHGNERAIHSVSTEPGKKPEITPAIKNFGLQSALMFFLRERLSTGCIGVSGELPMPATKLAIVS